MANVFMVVKYLLWDILCDYEIALFICSFVGDCDYFANNVVSY